ncbi:MAG: aspartate-semialdehyde dehydrogenase [Chloroflexi bacterium]|nr:aspartate-semialdehyde dehydrogenase [Chloroflexota bacterium]
MKGYNVAIVGATGLVGQEFIRVLEQRRFPFAELRLLASDRSVGRQMHAAGRELVVKEATEDAFRDIELALFSAGTDVSARLAPAAARAGAVVVDNSAAFRMHDDVPLVVPEVNPEDVAWHRGIIANPNCSTVQMVVALNPLHRVNRIRRVVVATYQSVSGAGAPAVDELREQVQAWAAGQPAGEAQALPQPIAFNVVPHIDAFLDNDYTKEEWKMVQETRKIMHEPDLAVSATTVRVPVVVGHSEAIWVEFERPFPPDEARAVLRQAPGVVVVDDPARKEYPLPTTATGTDPVYVGRIRADLSHPNGLVLWVVADNLRKGAALNAVQIAELLAARAPVAGRP